MGIMAMIFFKNNCKNALLKLLISGIWVLTFTITLSCSGDGDPTEPGESRFPAKDLSYSLHIQPIFSQNCSFAPCHDSGTRVGGLDLQSEPLNFLSNSGLVVLPFSRTQSLLYELLFQSTQNISRMPPSSARLADDEIEAIGQWIDEGALPN